MKSLWTFAIASLALFTATTASAILPYPCGWYLEGNYGETHAEGINVGSLTKTGEGNGPGWGLNGGYKFMPNFAAEIGYTDYAETHIENVDDATIGRVKHYSIQLAAKGIWPWSTTGIDLFAKLGVAYIHSTLDIDSDDDDGNSNSSENAYVGGGIEYALAHELLLNVQWERAFGNSHTCKLDLLSVGIALLFA